MLTYYTIYIYIYIYILGHIVNNDIGREEAKIRLIKLSLKGRRVKSNREEAFRFLSNCGKVSNQEKDITVLPTSKKAIQILPETVVAAAISWTASPVKKKADYATLFRLNHNKKIAIGYLVTVAEHSKKHTLHQYNAHYLLHTYARRGFLHLINRI